MGMPRKGEFTRKGLKEELKKDRSLAQSCEGGFYDTEKDIVLVKGDRDPAWSYGSCLLGRADRIRILFAGG